MKNLNKAIIIALGMALPLSVMASPGDDVTIRMMEMNEHAADTVTSHIELPDTANDHAREHAANGLETANNSRGGDMDHENDHDANGGDRDHEMDRENEHEREMDREDDHEREMDSERDDRKDVEHDGLDREEVERDGLDNGSHGSDSLQSGIDSPQGIDAPGADTSGGGIDGSIAGGTGPESGSSSHGPR
jgi:hypothetical protein